MSGHGHDHGPLAGPISATEVSDGIYAYIQNDGTWWINNTGFMVGSTGVIAIDACSTVARTEALISTIRGVSAQPVRTLVNTHHHGDHTFGNFLFDTATIVGHERMRDAIAAFGLPGAKMTDPYFTPVEWGPVQLAPPTLTFSDQVRVWVDDIEPTLHDYIAIPCVSVSFDPDWRAHGHLDRAIELVRAWCAARDIAGLTVEVVEIPGRTPVVLCEVPAHGGEFFVHADQDPVGVRVVVGGQVPDRLHDRREAPSAGDRRSLAIRVGRAAGEHAIRITGMQGHAVRRGVGQFT